MIDEEAKAFLRAWHPDLSDEAFNQQFSDIRYDRATGSIVFTRTYMPVYPITYLVEHFVVPDVRADGAPAPSDLPAIKECGSSETCTSIPTPLSESESADG